MIYLRNALLAARDRWITFVATTLLVAGACFTVLLLQPTSYTAQTTFYVSSQVGDNASAAYQGGLLSAQRVTSYVDLMRSTRVSSEIVRQLALPDTAEALASHVNATNRSGSVLIDVAVKYTDPVVARNIADAIDNIVPPLVAELERPLAGGPPAVVVKVVEPPSVPTVSDNLGPEAIGAIALALGLLVGLGVVLVINYFDDTIKSVDALRATVSAPFISSIPADVHSATVGPGSEHANAAFQEAFKQARVNLQYIAVDRENKSIVVTSSKPGEGKTTVSVNLAHALAAAGFRTLLIDADMRRPMVAEVLELEGNIGLSSVLAGRIAVHEAIQSSTSGLKVLTSGQRPPNPSELLSSNRMSELLRETGKHFSYVIIDTPPILGVSDASALSPLTDGVLLVCRFGSTTHKQLSECRYSVAGVDTDIIGTIMTFARSRSTQYDYYYTKPETQSRTTHHQDDDVDTATLSGGDRVLSGAAGHADTRMTPRPSPRRRL